MHTVRVMRAASKVASSLTDASTFTHRTTSRMTAGCCTEEEGDRGRRMIVTPSNNLFRSEGLALNHLVLLRNR